MFYQFLRQNAGSEKILPLHECFIENNKITRNAKVQELFDEVKQRGMKASKDQTVEIAKAFADKWASKDIAM